MNAAEYSWSATYYLLYVVTVACAYVQWKRWWPHMLRASEEKQPMKLHTRLLCVGTAILILNFIRGIDPYCDWGWYAPSLVSLLHDVVSSLCFDAFAFVLLELFIKHVQDQATTVCSGCFCVNRHHRSWILATVCISFHNVSLALDLVVFYNPIRLWTALIGLQFGITFAVFYAIFILAIVRMSLIINTHAFVQSRPSHSVATSRHESKDNVHHDPSMARYKQNYNRLLVAAAIVTAALVAILVEHTQLAIVDLCSAVGRDTIVFRQVWDRSTGNTTATVASTFVFVPNLEWYGVPAIQSVCVLVIFYASWLPKFVAKDGQSSGDLTTALPSPNPLTSCSSHATPHKSLSSNTLESLQSGKNSRMSRQHYSVRFGGSTMTPSASDQTLSSKPFGQRVRAYWNALLFHLDLGCSANRLRVRVTDERNKNFLWSTQSPRPHRLPRRSQSHPSFVSTSQDRASPSDISVGGIATDRPLELHSPRPGSAVAAKPSVTLTLPMHYKLRMLKDPPPPRPAAGIEREIRLADDVSNAIADADELEPLPPRPTNPLPGQIPSAITLPVFVRSSYPNSM